MKILAIDLGKFNSVACLLYTTNNQSEFETITTQSWALEQLLRTTQPDQVLIETSSISGWVYDLIQGFGYNVIVTNRQKRCFDDCCLDCRHGRNAESEGKFAFGTLHLLQFISSG